MNTPNYERKVCDAVLRVLEKRTRELRERTFGFPMRISVAHRWIYV